MTGLHAEFDAARQALRVDLKGSYYIASIGAEPPTTAVALDRGFDFSNDGGPNGTA